MEHNIATHVHAVVGNLLLPDETCKLLKSNIWLSVRKTLYSQKNYFGTKAEMSFLATAHGNQQHTQAYNVHTITKSHHTTDFC